MYPRVVEVILRLMKNLADYQNNTNDMRKDINSVTKDLSTLGYTSEEINAAVVWLLKRLELKKEIDEAMQGFASLFEHKTYRILHEVERLYISPEAYGYVIQLRELGLIDAEQTELILERAMRSDSLSVTVEDMKRVIASVIFDPDYIGWQNHSLVMSFLTRANETVH